MKNKAGKVRTVLAFSLLIVLTLIVVVAVLVLMQWRVLTRVTVNLTVDQVIFTVGGKGSLPILKSASFGSITIEKFSRITLSPEELKLEDQAQENGQITVTPPISITGEDKRFNPAVTLAVIASEGALGRLKQIKVGTDSQVTLTALEVKGSQKMNITLKIDSQQSSAYLVIHNFFQLITDFCKIEGITGLPLDKDSLAYRGKLSKDSSPIEIKGQSLFLALTSTILPEDFPESFYMIDNIPVQNIDFEPSRITEGELSYPDYPNIEKVLFSEPDRIRLNQLDEFSIEKITLNPEHKGIQFRLHGIAKNIMIGSQGFLKDRRLTCFDILWHNPVLLVLLGLVVWMLPTAALGYHFYLKIANTLKKQIPELQRENEELQKENNKLYQKIVQPFENQIIRLQKENEKLQKENEGILNLIEIVPRKNPYVVGSPIITKEMFFGRSEIIRKIIQGIHHNHYYIKGERRSGKTSLLKRLAEEIENLNNPEYDFQPIPIDFQNISEESFFKSLCRELLKAGEKLAQRLQSKELLEKIHSEFIPLAEAAECSDDFVDLFLELYEEITPKLTQPIIFVFIINKERNTFCMSRRI